MIGRPKVKKINPATIMVSVTMVVAPVAGSNGDGEFLPYFHGPPLYEELGKNVLALSRTFEFAADAAKYGDEVKRRWKKGWEFERLNPRKSEAPQ